MELMWVTKRKELHSRLDNQAQNSNTIRIYFIFDLDILSIGTAIFK
jgi:hypothetical protein